MQIDVMNGEADYLPPFGQGPRWAVGASRSKKRIHRAGCKYAKHPYNWAGTRSERQLFDDLLASGAIAWHDAGKCCSENLDWAIYWATRQNPPEPEQMAQYRMKLDHPTEGDARAVRAED